MLARVYSAALDGLEAYPVEVEVASKTGVPGVTIIGLPDAVIRESKDRIRSSIFSSSFKFKKKYYVINLAPADTKKEGAAFDLPIALGMLAAMGYIPHEAFAETLILGELSLDGQLRPTHGVLSTVLMGRARGYKRIILPKANADEAALVTQIEVIAVETLQQAVFFMQQAEAISGHRIDLDLFFQHEEDERIDFAEVKGQSQAKRVLEIAAAGGHNVILRGSPGCGKTMLARRFPSILPPLSLEEALEVTQIYSIAGQLKHKQALITQRPFRHPHHTASHISLVGGGSYPKPGEVSLAHHGVLFLDEMPEFRREVLEVLRQPLEDGVVTISRAMSTLSFPAKFMLLGALNPCKCGYLNDPYKECTCDPFSVQKYISKISGPLLDRVDLQLDVPRLKETELHQYSDQGIEKSVTIRERVLRARAVQHARLRASNIFCNANMLNQHIKEFCLLRPEATIMLERASHKFRFSGRVFHRILKVARTVADLSEHALIETPDIAEAIQYRGFADPSNS